MPVVSMMKDTFYIIIIVLFTSILVNEDVQAKKLTSFDEIYKDPFALMNDEHFYKEQRNGARKGSKVSGSRDKRIFLYNFQFYHEGNEGREGKTKRKDKNPPDSSH